MYASTVKKALTAIKHDSAAYIFSNSRHYNRTQLLLGYVKGRRCVIFLQQPNLVNRWLSLVEPYMGDRFKNVLFDSAKQFDIHLWPIL